MRSRRATAPSPLEASPSDEMIDAPPPDDDEVAPRIVRADPDAASHAGPTRVCVACGDDPDEGAGCDHAEVALFDAPRRGVRDAIERLRRAADERRAAERALRALVTSEFARGRAEFEAHAPAVAPAASGERAVAAESPCARCAERDAVDVARAAEAPATGSPRNAVPSRRRAAAAGVGATSTQQTFAFAVGPAAREPA